jgi:hypothetical protein
MKHTDKKVKRIVLLCVCIVLALALTGGAIYLANMYGADGFNDHDRTAYADERPLLTFREPFTADYIWIEENGVAVWAAFAKEIVLEKDADSAVLDIACDTYYWLWVNGEEIVWEGGLKRGVTPNDGFYDHVEIKDKFKAGKNTVSILVRHLGDDGYSHKDSGLGGLVVEGYIGDQPFGTDGTWKAKKFAYSYGVLDFFDNLNYRLSEKGSKIDGTAYTEFWHEPTDDWANARVIDKQKSQAAFGRSYLNPLPQKTVGDVVYWDLSGYDIDTSRSNTLTFDLAVNTQFCPYFELQADQQGKKITYYTENKRLNYKNTYTAKQGDNRFLDFAWINGERLTVTLDKGVRLKAIGYRATGYGATPMPRFESGDDALDTLWQKAANTLAVTMRDSYMDCPDRERAQWIGDAVIESEMSFYSLSPESAALFRKAIITSYGWVHKDGVIQTVVPDGVKAYELPMQNLAFLVGAVNYVLYSGDQSVTPMILSMAEGYLPLWEMKKGLVRHRKGSWDWGDWGDNIDTPALENAWYYYAMARLMTIAPPDSDLATLCRQRMESIADAYTAYYRSGVIASGKKVDDRALAIAVLGGLYRAQDAQTIADALYSVRNSSPYMEKYVEQALCTLGRVDLALARAKEVYADMIADDCTTLWEFWEKQKGTTNHAWAGGTLYVLSRYVGGVYPTANGFDTYVVQPDTDVLQDFEVALNPVDGVEISVKAEHLDGDRQKITVCCSSTGGTLIVTGKNCVFNGVHFDSPERAEHRWQLSVGTNELIFER